MSRKRSKPTPTTRPAARATAARGATRSIADLSAAAQAAEAARLLAMPDDAWQPLTTPQKALHVAARKRGRPAKPKGERKVKAMVAFDPKLLPRVDALASKLKTTRSGLIDSLLRILIEIEQPAKSS